jgi:hypothetical protein
LRAGPPPLLVEGELVDREDADEDGATGTRAVGDAVRTEDFRLYCWLQALGEGIDPSLKRASAGDSFGYLKACAQNASKKSQLSRPALMGASGCDDDARLRTGRGASWGLRAR